MNRVHDWVKGSLLGALLTACVCERDPPVSTGADSEGPQPTVLNAAPADSAAIPPVERAAEDSGALPTGSGRYVVQVGAYKHRAAAVAFAEDLSLMGLAVIGVPIAGAGAPSRRERFLTAGLLLVLLYLAAMVLWGLTGLSNRGLEENMLGLGLAFASGTFIALATEGTRRMNQKGVGPEAVLAVRFIAIIVISGAAVGLDDASALPTGRDLGLLGVAALCLIVAPLYMLQIGVARTSALSVWILLALGPSLVFCVQFLDGRLRPSLYTLAGIALYSLIAIWMALGRKYERPD